jgi:hypothetical protein
LAVTATIKTIPTVVIAANGNVDRRRSGAGAGTAGGCDAVVSVTDEAVVAVVVAAVVVDVVAAVVPAVVDAAVVVVAVTFGAVFTGFFAGGRLGFVSSRITSACATNVRSRSARTAIAFMGGSIRA